MNKSMVSKLPQELIDEIIGYLRDDKLTLSSCSLTCRTWTPFSRKLLFRSVQITPFVMPAVPHEQFPSVEVPDWSAFGRTFSAVPCLAACVEEFRIKGTGVPEYNSDARSDIEELGGYSDDEDSWKLPGGGWHYVFIGLDALFAMTQVLPNLKHLYLQDLVIGPGTLSPGTSSAIESLTLKNVGIMLTGSLLWELLRVFCPRDKVDIDVFWRQSTEFSDPAYPALYASFSARTWRVRADPSVENILRHLAGTSFVEHVESLDVKFCEDDELHSLVHVIGACLSNLEVLKLDVRDAFVVVGQDVLMMSDIGDVWDDDLDFGTCHRLEAFELAVRMGLTRRSGGTIHDIVRALSTLPTTIRRIRLVIDFVFFGPDLLHLPWENLNKVLRTKENVQVVELVLLNDGGSNEIMEDTREHLSFFFSHSLQDISHTLRLSFS